ncbi:FAD/NAD(P)-binding domain-containing protein [Irpex rosettiformis]|uniref:FAD/NAD(P)-binding domain-containing protein n=1 Tax=Irpex rosettiformis TaxID=378272 RepID=A0ACB8UIW2_9APHY|nr:FAD/NAD(P)-binding domain-containing protein [Irpex rosettiformis]
MFSTKPQVPSRNPPNDLKIVIVGGGVCGLVCCIALKQFGMEAHLYEAAAKFGEIGAAIGIGNNTANILDKIGVLDTLFAKADIPPQARHSMVTFYDGEGDHEAIYDPPSGPAEGSFGVTRTVFLDSLVDHVDPKLTHFNKRFTKVTQVTSDSGRQVVHFADGTTVEADVVLLANGIRGAGRDVVTGVDPKKSVVFANTVYYRALAHSGAIKEAALDLKTDILKRACIFMGTNKHAVIVPVAGGTLINISAVLIDNSVKVGEVELADDEPRVVQTTKDELLKNFEEWGNDARIIMGSVETVNKWLVEVLHPSLETYVKGKVALLGDAAHAMAPHLGAGAGQGIEDAYLLAQLLSDPQTTKANVEAVLKTYDAVRRPRAQAVWEATQRAGRTYEGHGNSGNSAEGRRRDLEGQWAFIWHHGVNDDRDIALKLLRGQGVFL